MKSIDPRESSLDINKASLSDRQSNKPNKLWLAGLTSVVVGGAIALASTIASTIANSVQAQQPKPLANAPCLNTQSGMPNRGMMMTGEVADRHFIEMMIPHHDGAVKMSDLALKRSQSPKVRQLAKAIKRDQTREIAQMQNWYKQWYKTDVPNLSGRGMSNPNRGMMGMHGGMMGHMMTTDLTMLETAADSDFDQAFLAEMIPHHKMALMMTHMIVDSDRPELRKLARDILVSQSQEIEQMRVMLKS